MNKLTLKVNEPEIRYSGNVWWIQNDNAGWDISENTMKYNNVKIRMDKSEDSFFHVKYYKYSAGRNLADVQNRAAQTMFNIDVVDSTLNLGSGLTINSASKFRGQGVIVEIQVPVGKKVRFDESLENAYSAWVVRRSVQYRNWGGPRYRIDWDNDEYLNWEVNQDYVMTSEGKLMKPDELLQQQKESKGSKNNADSLKKKIEEREQQNEKDRQRLEEMQNSDTEQNTTKAKTKEDKETFTLVTMPFVPLVI